MAPVPSLVPLPPQRTAPVSLNTSPFWLGSNREAGYPLFLPTVVARHAVLVERADGYWILPGSGPTSVNGAPIGSGVLLHHGDVIRLAPGGEFRFDSGEAPATPPPEAVVESVPAQRSKRRKVSCGEATRLRQSNRIRCSCLTAAGGNDAVVRTSVNPGRWSRLLWP